MPQKRCGKEIRTNIKKGRDTVAREYSHNLDSFFSDGSVVQRKQPYHRDGRCIYKRAATFEPPSSSSLLEDSKGDSYVVPSWILYIPTWTP